MAAKLHQDGFPGGRSDACATASGSGELGQRMSTSILLAFGAS